MGDIFDNFVDSCKADGISVVKDGFLECRDDKRGRFDKPIIKFKKTVLGTEYEWANALDVTDFVDLEKLQEERVCADKAFLRAYKREESCKEESRYFPSNKDIVFNKFVESCFKEGVLVRLQWLESVLKNTGDCYTLHFAKLFDGDLYEFASFPKNLSDLSDIEFLEKSKKVVLGSVLKAIFAAIAKKEKAEMIALGKKRKKK